MNQQYPSALLEKAVNEFAKLPGIGAKTAMRLVLHLLRQDTQAVEGFGQSLITLKHEVKYCSVCHNISDTELCAICADVKRDHSTVCVVENIQDVMAIENTHQYKGVYHVLGGVISPMDGWALPTCKYSRLWTACPRGRVRGDSGSQSHDGRRHHQFLYLPETGAFGSGDDRDSPRRGAERRVAIYRRSDVGPFHRESCGF